MSELGNRAASLAGLAPLARESGAWKGRRFIQGGREKLRRLLYMPAVAAIRCNPDLASKYTALRDAGKPPKVAITAVMRKLVVLANILVQKPARPPLFAIVIRRQKHVIRRQKHVIRRQ